jgi:hypothetical protein
LAFRSKGISKTPQTLLFFQQPMSGKKCKTNEGKKKSSNKQKQPQTFYRFVLSRFTYSAISPLSPQTLIPYPVPIPLKQNKTDTCLHFWAFRIDSKGGSKTPHKKN